MIFLGLLLIALLGAPLVAAGTLGKWAHPLIKLSALVSGLFSILFLFVTFLFGGAGGIVFGALALCSHGVAALISRVQRRNLRRGLALVTALIASLPGIYFSVSGIRDWRTEQRNSAIWSELSKSPTLPAQLGAVRLSLPFSPVLELEQYCDATAPERVLNCGELGMGLRRGVRVMRAPPSLPNQVAQLEGLTLHRFGPSCTDTPSAVGCLSPSVLHSSCEARPELAASPWCMGGLSHEVWLRAAGGHSTPISVRLRGYDPSTLPKLKPDATGKPVGILCSDTRDKMLRERPEAGLSRLCAILYQPRQGIEALIILDHMSPAEMLLSFAAARAELAPLLDAMIDQP